MGFSIRLFYLLLVFTIFISFFFFLAGLLIAANPAPMASLRHFSVLTKNSLCSNSFASTEKYSDGLIYTRICLKDENYILNYLKILGFLYPCIRKVCNKSVIYMGFNITFFVLPKIINLLFFK